jgi:hypothetical protein
MPLAMALYIDLFMHDGDWKQLRRYTQRGLIVDRDIEPHRGSKSLDLALQSTSARYGLPISLHHNRKFSMAIEIEDDWRGRAKNSIRNAGLSILRILSTEGADPSGSSAIPPHTCSMPNTYARMTERSNESKNKSPRPLYADRQGGGGEPFENHPLHAPPAAALPPPSPSPSPSPPA